MTTITPTERERLEGLLAEFEVAEKYLDSTRMGPRDLILKAISRLDLAIGAIKICAPHTTRLAVAALAELERVEAERDRLRVALEAWWYLHNPDTMKPQSIGWHRAHQDQAIALTRAALAPEVADE